MRLSELEWETAKRVCTEKQRLALDLWRRGAGKHRIAMVMGVDPSTARGHVKSGQKKIADALEREAA